MFTKGFSKTAGRLGARLVSVGKTTGMNVERLRQNAAKELRKIHKTKGPQAAQDTRRSLLHDIRKLQERVMGGQKAKGTIQ